MPSRVAFDSLVTISAPIVTLSVGVVGLQFNMSNDVLFALATSPLEAMNFSTSFASTSIF